MGDDIWSADGESTIQHPSAEDEAIARITGIVFPGAPYKRVGRVWLAVDVRHDGTDNDGDQDASNDEEGAQLLDLWNRSVHEQADEGGEPDEKDVGHKDLPSLDDESIVHHGVHGNRVGGHDLCGSSQPKDPSEEIPPPGEPAARTSVFASCDTGPVVN